MLHDRIRILATGLPLHSTGTTTYFSSSASSGKNINYLYHEKTILDYCHGKIPFSEENIILNIELFFSLHLLKKSRVLGKSKVSNIPM